jgi:AcrR family transcriptional regulator
MARRAQIVGCAADVIAQAGYAQATMAEIARQAGVAKSVISYHFADKNELMQELIRTAVATFTETRPGQQPELPPGPARPSPVCSLIMDI